MRWQKKLPLASGAPYAGMPSANIAALGDLIFVPAWNLYALDRATGEIRWRFEPADDLPGWDNVFVSDGQLFAAGRFLYALNPDSGRVRWRTDLGEQPFRPVLLNGTLFVGTRGQVAPGTLGNGHAVALDPKTGAVLCRLAIRDSTVPVNGGSIGPVAIRDTVGVIAGVNGTVYAFDPRTGDSLWTNTTQDHYEAGITIIDHTVIVAGDAGSVRGLDLTTGHVLWQTPEGTSIFKRITLGDSVALVTTGILSAFDARGQLLWRLGGAGYGGPVYSTSATYRNGTIYIGSVASDAPGPGFYALRAP